MHYLFAIKDHGRTIHRQERELVNDGAARAEALCFAAGILDDPALDEWNGRDLAVEVGAVDGALRFTVHILSVVAPQTSGEEEQSQIGETEAHPS